MTMARLIKSEMATKKERSTASGRGRRHQHRFGRIRPEADGVCRQLSRSMSGVSKYLSATAMMNGIMIDCSRPIAV